jgi:hypothetical protein
MERVNQFSFYELGQELKDLQSLDENTDGWVAVLNIMAARRRILRLIEGKPIPIGLCRPAAESLVSALDKALEDARSGEEGKRRDPQPIPSWRWSSIKRALTTFEHVFAAEMGGATVYFVPSRGIYNTPALVDSAESTFPEALRTHIPEKAISDWKAAGRCLAFNLLTASGFHVVRAVEGTLETYYQLFAGKLGKTLKNWNDYIVALEKLSSATPAPSLRTIAELKQMKDDFRNPVVHPRVSLDDVDARMLFSNGEALILAMSSEIKNVKDGQGGVQPPLLAAAEAPEELPKGDSAAERAKAG